MAAAIWRPIHFLGGGMENFWDDMFDSPDEDTDDKVPDILRALATMIPEYKEMQRYLKKGMEHILEVYGGDATKKEDEHKLHTEKDTPHCVIVDAAMIDTLDDEIMADLSRALNKYKLTDEPEDVFTELKRLVHFQVHIGMCLGIGMGLEDGTLRRE
jgi:hypothetical protein